MSSPAPVKVVDVELDGPLPTLQGLESYGMVRALVRLHGTPVGWVECPVRSGRVSASALYDGIMPRLGWPVLRHLLCDFLATRPTRDGVDLADVVGTPHPPSTAARPTVTVAVCTRDRTSDLARCLDSLRRLEDPPLEIFVVDNAPRDDATRDLVRSTYPDVRYVREPRPGLDWARNRAILEARGEIVAFTDDDVVVDAKWTGALARVFADHPDVMAVTGLVTAHELETHAQLLFELYGGFDRGFYRKWHRVNPLRRREWPYHGTGQFGTGANMAYRRSVFERIGYFDPALDVGTVTNGGGDLEMFFRVVKEGHTLVYEPRAVVRHCHRRDYARLRTQLFNNGIGLYAYFMRGAAAYPDERIAFLRLALWWLQRWHLRRLLVSLLRPSRFPRDLIWAELTGSFLGPLRYRRARSTAAAVGESAEFANEPTAQEQSRPAARSARHVRSPRALAVRTVDLGSGVEGLSNVTDYDRVRVFVTWDGELLGAVDVINNGAPLSASRLREAIVDGLFVEILACARDLTKTLLWESVQRALHQRYRPASAAVEGEERRTLPADVTVTVVVATCDRPEHLRHCLRSILAQETPRDLEIVVVDNNPRSGVAAPVVAEFPTVRLVNEWRKGVAYARNAGFAASTGEIVVTTDDDVSIPHDWIEKLVAPFAESRVMAVTGNVLPLELETPAQRIFEAYGGLGRGYVRVEADTAWFEAGGFRAVETWKLGGTANAAFRSVIFRDPAIGVFDEALGPGMPSGVGEDTYLFYRILKAGHAIVYEPGAYVWHRHRRSLSALARQIYNYSKGHVSYHLTTFLHDGDLRALLYLLLRLPRAHGGRFWHRVRRRGEYPAWLVLVEVAGNVVGPWALWRSRRRVKRWGRSEPCRALPHRDVPSEAPAPTRELVCR